MAFDMNHEDDCEIEELVLKEDSELAIEADVNSVIDDLVGEDDSLSANVSDDPSEADTPSLEIDADSVTEAELAELEFVLGEAQARVGYSGSKTLALDRSKLDWSDMSSSTRHAVCEAADRIHALRDSTASNLIEIGKELCAVKDRLDHSKFGPWLAAEFNWSERTAQRYMIYARTFGNVPNVVAALPQAILDKLVAKGTPEAVRESIVEKIEAGNVPTSADILESISQARAAEAQARATEEMSRQAEALKKKIAAMTPEEKEAFERSEKDKAMAAQEARELQEKAKSERKQGEPDEEGRRRKAIELAEWLLDQLGADFTIFCDRFDGASLELSEALKIVRGRSSGATPQGTIHAALALAA